MLTWRTAQWQLLALAILVLATATALRPTNPQRLLPLATYQLKGQPALQSLCINEASTAELMRLPGVGPKRAQQLVVYRAVHGSFKNLADLRQVPGIGPITALKLRPFLRWRAASQPAQPTIVFEEPLQLSTVTLDSLRTSGLVSKKELALLRTLLAQPGGLATWNVLLDKVNPLTLAAWKANCVLRGKPANALVDLNTAGSEQLQRLPRIGPVLANRILAHRSRRGGFARLADLEEVSGIGPKTIAGLRAYATLSPVRTRMASQDSSWLHAHPLLAPHQADSLWQRIRTGAPLDSSSLIQAGIFQPTDWQLVGVFFSAP